MPSLLGQQSQGMLASPLGAPDFCRPQAHFTSFVNKDYGQPLCVSPSICQARFQCGMEDESTHKFMTGDVVEQNGSIINSTTSKAAAPLGVSLDSEEQYVTHSLPTARYIYLDHLADFTTMSRYKRRPRCVNLPRNVHAPISTRATFTFSQFQCLKHLHSQCVVMNTEPPSG